MGVEPGARLGLAEAELGRGDREVFGEALERASADVLGRVQFAVEDTVGERERLVPRGERAGGVEVVIERVLQILEPRLGLGRDLAVFVGRRGLADGELLAEALERQIRILAAPLRL